MKYRVLMVLLALGLGSGALAAEKKEYPNIVFVGPGTGNKIPTPRDQFIILVVEGPFISYENNPIPAGGVADYVNNLLKIKGVSYVGVHVREGVKYGDVVQALDVLRKTNAKDIGVSMVVIPVGLNP